MSFWMFGMFKWYILTPKKAASTLSLPSAQLCSLQTRAVTASVAPNLAALVAWRGFEEVGRSTDHVEIRIGLRENLPESPIFDGKNHGFLQISPKTNPVILNRLSLGISVATFSDQIFLRQKNWIKFANPMAHPRRFIAAICWIYEWENSNSNS
jgi:hypothetical protein